MKNFNKTPVKQRPFRNIKKRLAKKWMYYDPYWFEHKDLKVGDIAFDHPGFEQPIKSIRIDWFRHQKPKGRCKWIVIAFEDGSYPCGCCPLELV